jgi:hypothetical protein
MFISPFSHQFYYSIGAALAAVTMIFLQKWQGVELTSGDSGTRLAIVCAITRHPLIRVMPRGHSTERARMTSTLQLGRSAAAYHCRSSHRNAASCVTDIYQHIGTQLSKDPRQCNRFAESTRSLRPLAAHSDGIVAFRPCG